MNVRSLLETLEPRLHDYLAGLYIGIMLRLRNIHGFSGVNLLAL
jgi:hypothetical protein